MTATDRPNPRPLPACVATVAFLTAALLLLPAPGVAQHPSDRGPDPRIGLSAGWFDAGQAAWNMELIATRPRPEGFFNPETPGDGRFSNTDLAFRDDFVFVGNYNGFQIWDVTSPASPSLRTAVVCPGGQGDVSVHGNLLFMSVQETRARLDCGTQGTLETVDPERFRGVRIFDISNLDTPQQIAAVQTCRGSHTHTLVSDPNDPSTLYVYNSGTSVARSGEELAGCSDVQDPDDPTTSYWSIDVIEVPLAAPQNARLIDSPRVFADEATGDISGLWQGGDHGPGTQSSRQTNQCHDITAYPSIGLAGGACSGNGILFDINNPAVPVRLDDVVDPGFAYWHSATFNNDGSTVLFTDEWGGGGQPRCLATDRPEWGANALFRVVGGKMHFASYYKLPAAQTAMENCVAHNGSLVPVPGRDIKVQAWYQGGVSVFDFTDPSNPYEIAFFDRGPLSDSELFTGGYWSTYWYNGRIYGSEISRGLDVLELLPNEHLTANELEAAKLVQMQELNPQEQPTNRWPAAFPVVRAFLDQAERHGAMSAIRLNTIRQDLNGAEAMPAGQSRVHALSELAISVWGDARRAEEEVGAGDPDRIRNVAGALLDLVEASW
ncbi:MAG: hypothetical protein WEA09_13855 [Gemmatimonadota bacterium]